jgi:hypothetical protein
LEDKGKKKKLSRDHENMYLSLSSCKERENAENAQM